MRSHVTDVNIGSDTERWVKSRSWRFWLFSARFSRSDELLSSANLKHSFTLDITIAQSLHKLKY